MKGAIPDANSKFGAHRQSIACDTLLRLIEVYYEFDHIAVDARTMRRALQRLLRDPAIGRAWLAEADGAAAGYLILTHNYDIEFGGMQGIVTDLYLEPGYRRQGLGARLIATALASCRSRRIGTMELQVTRTNRRALSFYRKIGFKTLDRIVVSIDVATTL